MAESFLNYVQVGRVGVYAHEFGCPWISQEGINPIELELPIGNYEPPNVGVGNQTNC